MTSKLNVTRIFFSIRLKVGIVRDNLDLEISRVF